MIKKIIASDIDGTLLPFGESELNPHLFNLIEDFRKKGILFVPASGRTIANLHEIFEPVKDELSYLSENGGAVWYYNDQIAQFPIPRDELKRLYEVIKEHPYLEGYANAPLNAYTIKDTLVDGSLLNRPFSPPPEVVDKLEDIDDTIVKFTAMCIQGQKAEPFFSDMLSRFSPSLDVAIAGPDVIDFCKTNKGIGLKTLADYLNLSSSDVIAFGDNYNDLEMLKYAGTSFMVQTDDPNLQAAAAYLTRDPLKEMENIYIKS